MITKEDNADLGQPKSCKTCALRRTCTLITHPIQGHAIGYFNIPLPGAPMMPMPCGGNAYKPAPRERRARPQRFFADLVPEAAVPEQAIGPDDIEFNDSGLPI